MCSMIDLFTGTGIAHSILLFAFIIAAGLYLSRFKIKGISIGSTWILFLAILVSHFGFRADPVVMAFMKDFGLILFVFSIGLQVGPGFFHSFKTGGVRMNLLALFGILMAVLVTVCIHLVTGESLQNMVGVMSGAVTNTPGLGAAQQTLSDAMTAMGSSRDVTADAVSDMASAYAVAYPIGVLGVIFLVILFRSMFRIDIGKEKAELDSGETDADTARRMHVEVENPAVFGLSIRSIMKDAGDKFLISRMMRDGQISIPGPDTVLEKGDRLLIVTSQQHVDTVRIIFGEEVPMHRQDWVRMNESLVTRRLAVTKSSITGKRIKDLGLGAAHGVIITRVVRSGVELVARPNLILQMGDSILAVGFEPEIKHVASIVGNKPENLSHPNLVPIFFGIALGVIFGSLPIRFPGIPQPVKLGLAGGPLIIAILLGYFGPKWKITTYTTLGANMMLREIGIAFFLASVGLGAGEDFVSSIVDGGYWWILYGALITLVPIFVLGLVARLVFKLNFYQLCGLIAGSTTDPAVLSFAQGAYGTDYTSVNYATVYPLSMFLRVLAAQLLILFSL
ncbi:MAG: putative transporter [Bacteroidales bacterium]|nr:putative transporter [Bacteroidales bacterium]